MERIQVDGRVLGGMGWRAGDELGGGGGVTVVQVPKTNSRVVL